MLGLDTVVIPPTSLSSATLCNFRVTVVADAHVAMNIVLMPMCDILRMLGLAPVFQVASGASGEATMGTMDGRLIYWWDG